MTSAQLRAGIYDRESKGSESSITSQNSTNRRAVQAQDWILVGEYTDETSASRFRRKDRKNYPKLVADLEAGVLDVVVTTEPSRVNRDLEAWVPFVGECRRRGVLVHLSGEDETLDPRKVSHWKRLINMGVDAAAETDLLSQRVKRGIKDAAVEGGFHGRAPYGYERVIVGEETVTRGGRTFKKPLKEQRIHPEQGPVVIDILRRVSRGEPIINIVDDLNARGIPAKRGGK